MHLRRVRGKTRGKRARTIMATLTKKPYQTRYHRDGTVTIWDVYAQQWLRTSDPSDRVLASLSDAQRERVIRHCGRYWA